MDILKQQKIERYIIMFFGVIMLGLFWYYDVFQLRTFDGNYNDAYFWANDVEIGVDIAKTPEHLELGFSNRKRPAINQGVLFDFGEPVDAKIWMKDMKFVLDIIWLSKDFEILVIKEGVRPQTYPGNFLHDEKVRYVLELPASAVREIGLKEGYILKKLGK